MLKGFTLIELAIMIAIIATVVTIVLSIFSTLNSSQVLQASGEVVKATIEKAQTLTLSSRSDSQYGVHFDSNQVVLFKGVAYSVNDANNATTTLSTKVSITSIQLTGGGSEIIFDRLTGATSQYGTTTVTLSSDSSKKIQIVVAATGVVNSQ